MFIATYMRSFITSGWGKTRTRYISCFAQHFWHLLDYCP